ncbi:MAG TPA: sulfate adenylyltransferase [Candidatus Hydrogenedentes bacterium]|nr:MAG: Sulfate adenylyltransferase [Candidatus Hydrogenedentes bacterium ADurb.Bin170]HNZ48524.1 sulfate adenylyltransferase [Candidatus Hydrogenedentota bacterium]HOD95552.1 sulfate adenylyltransferase [Candidatus Hydrogenedentota bacterium]HOR51002.1 sulfate adenylyltransferase [Candidatus Hydrogenedentota bacterium]HPK24914.1 sulfate adenylyltransferase [Candidatus Hydrogenedentota bacterium]
MSIAPHGGELKNCFIEAGDLESFKRHAASLPVIQIDAYTAFDVDAIAKGIFSPLEGFLGKEDTLSVLESMCLKTGLPWTIPVLFSVDTAVADTLELGQEVALKDDYNQIIAVMNIAEKFQLDKKYLAEKVYRTTETAHPGVAYTFSTGDVYLAGQLKVAHSRPVDHQEYNLSPLETRAAFKERGWKRIVAFQTRNPIHRAHEYLTKCALEMCDGLLIHPLMGTTKSDDIPGDIRMKCYEVLLDKYYPKEHVMLSIMPVNMRYAGPREAVMHAIIRKNYGCTHFIVGRDHAGVGNYYGSYDAHYIFDEIDPAALGITPLFFEHAFFSKRTNDMATKKTCPGSSEEHVFLSGTKVRELLANGEAPPVEFTRPEVAQILIEWATGK